MQISDAESGYGLTWRVTPDLLGILNSSGVFEQTNPAWLKTLGRLPEDIESRPFFDFVHPDDVERTNIAFQEILRGRPVLKFENRYRHKDGSYHWLSWNAVPDGDKFFCSARDITDHKKKAAALRSHEDEAKLREQFIAVLSHDLRNPLAAVTSANRMLRRDSLSGQSLEILAAADKSLARMSNLIDDLTDFARCRLGSGVSLELNNKEPLKPALEHTVDEILLANPNVLIKSEYDFQDPVECDIGRMKQLLSNLLANAVAHGDAGRPIGLSARDEGERFILSVSNHGPAISVQDRERLFQPFVRQGLHDSQGGLGLGLFICAEIARAHTGELRVSSDESLTEFTFEMPRS